jgi:hypothetical protein
MFFQATSPFKKDTRNYVHGANDAQAPQIGMTCKRRRHYEPELNHIEAHLTYSRGQP